MHFGHYCGAGEYEETKVQNVFSPFRAAQVSKPLVFTVSCDDFLQSSPSLESRSHIFRKQRVWDLSMTQTASLFAFIQLFGFNSVPNRFVAAGAQSEILEKWVVQEDGQEISIFQLRNN